MIKMPLYRCVSKSQACVPSDLAHPALKHVNVLPCITMLLRSLYLY